MRCGINDVKALVNRAKGFLDENSIEYLDSSDDFALINVHIAFTAALEKKSLYISTHDKQSALSLTLPIFYATACKILSESDASAYPSIDILVSHYAFTQGGTCWKYIVKDGKHSLVSVMKQGRKFKHFNSIDQIVSSYFAVDDRYYSDNKCHKYLDQYKKFFAELTNSPKHPPSFFSKKLILICNKSHLMDMLRSKELFHCFPIASIISKQDGIAGETLPLDPLVLLASNYKIARDYMLSHRENVTFTSVIVIGDSMISKMKSAIKNDCANGLFEYYCLIGNSMIAKDNTMLLWHWSKREEKHLRGKHSIKIMMLPISGCRRLIEASEAYYHLLNLFLDEYGTLEHFGKSLQLFRKLLSDKLNLMEEIETSGLVTANKKEILNGMLADNYDIDDVTSDVDELFVKIQDVILSKMECDTIWHTIESINDEVIFMVVHNSVYESWNERLDDNQYSHIHLLSFSEFRKIAEKDSTKGKYYFTFLPGFKQIAWISSLVLSQKVLLQFILYPPEISILKSIQKKINNWERKNSGPKEKSLFPGVKLDEEERESSDDLIGRFEDTYTEYSEYQQPNASENNSYIAFTVEAINPDNKLVIITCPHKVMRKDNDELELTSIDDLEEGDEILVYHNQSRESLYEILSEESKKFASVNSFSNLWKNRLREYIRFQVKEESLGTNQSNVTCDQDRLKKLSLHTGIRRDVIIKQWVENRSNIMFPRKSSMESLLSFFIDVEAISATEAEDVRKSRTFFMGVMISLGHNLSSELQTILLNNNHDLEGYVTSSVTDNYREYPLLSRFDAITIKSIISHNFQSYKFVRIVLNDSVNSEE